MKVQLYHMEDNFHLMENFLTTFLFITRWRMEISTLNEYNLSLQFVQIHNVANDIMLLL